MSIETENHYILTKTLKHWTNINSFKTEEQEALSSSYCQCIKTKDKDEYWGYWVECECGYKSNTDGATYCGGCGKKIQIIETNAKFVGLVVDCVASNVDYPLYTNKL